jgi:sialic acid synthase SpsE
MPEWQIGKRLVGSQSPVYFIADISANHDGDLERARALIHLAAEAGADAAKFQNFRAQHIVSSEGFTALGLQMGHQAKWKRSVTDVYRAASLPWDWTPILAEECERAGIEYFSTPYDLESVDMLDPYVNVYKVGSGDITWHEMLRHVASKGKPVILATGAANLSDVQSAVGVLRASVASIGLLQCNTNYTGSLENFKHIHLNVLKTYGELFPDAVLGLSDHTPGHATALGSVALGGRIVEKHFTDDTKREGPDHGFSMTPATWREMVDRTRELELALGSHEKFVAANEAETVIVQRRSIRLKQSVEGGSRIAREDLEVLRPAPADSIPPYFIDQVIGMRVTRDLRKGAHLTWSLLEQPTEVVGR